LKLRKSALFILRICIGLGIILFLFKFIPYSRIIQLYKEANKIYIIISLVIFVMVNILGALRWRYILSSIGIDIHKKEAIYTYLSSLFFNILFPSLLGGDIFRSLALSYRHKKSFKVISSVVMDRFSGGFSLGIVTLVAYLLGGVKIRQYNILLTVSFFLFINIIAVLIVFNRYFFHRINKYVKGGTIKRRLVHFYNELYFFRNNPKIFFKSLLYSFAIQGSICFIFFTLSKAFFLKTDIFYFFILVPIIQFIATLPITIAGMGTREVASVYFFSKIGIDKSAALSLSFAFLFINIITSLLGGLIYVMVYHRWLERNT